MHKMLGDNSIEEESKRDSTMMSVNDEMSTIHLKRGILKKRTNKNDLQTVSNKNVKSNYGFDHSISEDSYSQYDETRR